MTPLLSGASISCVWPAKLNAPDLPTSIVARLFVGSTVKVRGLAAMSGAVPMRRSTPATAFVMRSILCTRPAGMSVYLAHAARVEYIVGRKYPDAALTVGAVAKVIGISTQHVCRVLRRERGLTFATLLR